MQPETPQTGIGQSLPTPSSMPPQAPRQSPQMVQPTNSAAPTDQYDDAPLLSWDASEYVHVEKGLPWLIGFFCVIAALLALAIWMGAWTFVAAILAFGLAMGVFAFRRPHTIHYDLDDDGIVIEGKLYPYHDFRAFGILQDGASFTMSLVPTKRFMPALSVYFPQEQGEHIVDIVGSHLPMEPLKLDIIDTIMRRLHF